MADKQHLEAMLTALDASPRALERPMCRGWIGDWQISGSDCPVPKQVEQPGF